MKICMFHLMPWPYLPDDFEEREPSAWVTYSNENFQAELGQQLYERYLSELVYAEELGFDAVSVNEHHQTAYGLMPSPNLIAMALIQRTTRVQVAIIGNAIALRDHPLRVAEEVAMLDVVSGGRVISGIVRGIGAEYHSASLNPAHSEERFREAHDLMVAAWTRPGPFAWHGKHYDFTYVNPWPTPMQKPHPPLWVPTQGSGSTVSWAAERHHTVAQTAAPVTNLARTMDQYWKAARGFGYEPHPHQLGWSPPIYVGKDDESAMEEFAPHVRYLYEKSRHRPPAAFFPPGYLTPSSWKGVMSARGSLGREKPTPEDYNARGEIVVGGPETVLRRLREVIDTTGIGTLLPMMHTGTMSHEMTIANLERFAEHVLPELADYLPDPPKPAGEPVTTEAAR